MVFIGADATCGPAADCCCDYLNFFTDRDAAEAWTGAHPHVQGQILDPTDAQDLGDRLFGHLLTASSTDDQQGEVSPQISPSGGTKLSGSAA